MTKNGRAITGNVSNIVIVQTNAGYEPAPGSGKTRRSGQPSQAAFEDVIFSARETARK
ncbi:MAG: hypothetical protein ABIP78_01185 [Pyrinomonadaceae bacterium]